MSDDPMNEIEVVNAMKNMARMTRAFYEELVEQGFPEQAALELTRAYLHGTAGGKLQ